MTAIELRDHVAWDDTSPFEAVRTSVQQMSEPAFTLPSSVEAVPEDPAREASVPAEQTVGSVMPRGSDRSRLASTKKVIVVNGISWSFGTGAAKDGDFAVDAQPTLRPTRPGDSIIGQSRSTDPGCMAAKERPPTGTMPDDRNSAPVPSGPSGGSATGTPVRMPALARGADCGSVRKPVVRGGRFPFKSQSTRIRVSPAGTTTGYAHVGRFTWAVLDLAVPDVHVGARTGVNGKTLAANVPCHSVRAKTQRLATDRDPLPTLSLQESRAIRDPGGNALAIASCRGPGTANVSVARVAESPRCRPAAPERLSVGTRRVAAIPRDDDFLHVAALFEATPSRANDRFVGLGAGRVMTARRKKPRRKQ